MALQPYSNYEHHHFIAGFMLNNSSGSLTIMPSNRKLFFDNGNLIYAVSEEKSEHFSEILVEMGAISPEDLQDVKSRLESNQSLGRQLRAEGLVSAQDLGLALKQQIMRIISRIFNLEDGQYEIINDELPEKLPKLKIHTIPLVIKSILQIERPNFPPVVSDDASIIKSAQFAELKAKAPSPSAYADLLDFIEVNENPTVDQSVSESDLPRDQVYKYLYAFQVLGLINYQQVMVDIPSHTSIALGGDSASFKGLLEDEPDTGELEENPMSFRGLLDDDDEDENLNEDPLAEHDDPTSFKEVLDQDATVNDSSLAAKAWAHSFGETPPMAEDNADDEDDSWEMENDSLDDDDNPFNSRDLDLEPDDLPEDNSLGGDSGAFDEDLALTEEEADDQEPMLPFADSLGDPDGPLEALNEAIKEFPDMEDASSTFDHSDMTDDSELNHPLDREKSITEIETEEYPIMAPTAFPNQQEQVPEVDQFAETRKMAAPFAVGEQEFNADDLNQDPAFNLEDDFDPEATLEPDTTRTTLKSKGYIMPEEATNPGITPPPPPQEEPKAKKGGGKRNLLLVALLVIVGGGAAAWHFLNQKDTPPAQQTTTITSETPKTVAGNQTDTSGDEEEAEEDQGRNIEENGDETQAQSPPTEVVTEDIPTDDATDIASADETVQERVEQESTASKTTPVKESTVVKNTQPAQTKAGGGTVTTGNDLSALAAESAAKLIESDAQFSIAFIVACEEKTLTAIFEQYSPTDLHILERKVNGNNCYILMWGEFQTYAEAQQAIKAMPAKLIDESDPPWVAKVATYLPN